MALLKFKRSATPSKVPTTSDLALGELALNTYDGKVYMKKDDGTQAIVEVGGTSGGGTVTSVGGTGTVNGLTLSGTVTSSGNLTLGGALAISNADWSGTDLSVANGGTGASSLTSGYLLKGNGTSPVSASVIYDSGTSVGIGTISPDSAALLDVVSSNGKYVRTKATAADSTTGYILANDARTWVIRANGSNSDALEFRNATSGRQEMVIDTSGNVGIGTSSPFDNGSGYGDLSLNGTNGGILSFLDNDVRQGWVGSVNDEVRLSTTTASGYLTFRTAGGGSGTERARIDSAGRLGVNTTAPAGLLSVASTSSAGTTIGSWTSAHSVFGPNVGSATGAALGLGYNTTTDTAEIVSIAPSVAWKNMRLIAATMDLETISGRVQTNQSFRAPIFYDSDNTGYFLDPSSGGTSLNVAGSVGIGRSPSTDKLEVAGSVKLTNLGAGQGLIGYNTSSQHWEIASTSATSSGVRFDVQGNQRLSINSAGNVTAAVDLRAPIFYDSNNSAYYVDPASTSVFNKLTTSRASSDQLKLERTNSDNNVNIEFVGTSTTRYLGKVGGDLKWGGNADLNNTGDTIFHDGYAPFANLTSKTSGTGTYQTSGDFRAPIFYDSDNTSYYVDAAGTTSASFASTVQFAATTQSKLNLYSSSYQIGIQGSTQYYRSNGRFSWFRGGVHSNSENNAGTGGTVAMTLDSSSNLIVTGNVTATTDLRAPIFYDSNNTAYYVDPASTSVVNQINYAAGLYFSGNTNYGINGTNAYFDTVNSGAVGDPLELCYSRGSEVRVGPSGGNLPIVAGTFARSTAHTGFLDGRYGSASSNSTVNPIYCISTSYAPTSSTTLGSMYGIGYTDGATSGVWSGGGWGMYVVDNGSVRHFLDASSGIGYTTGSYRAPIFYDSNNTAYYANPAGTSVLSSAQFDGIVRIATGSVGPANTTDGLMFDGNYINGQYRHRFRKRDDSGGIPLYLDYAAGTANSYTELMKFGPNTADGSYLTVYGIISSNTDIRAPIFYDSDNTGYYLNPASTSILNHVQIDGNLLQNSTNRAGLLQVNYSAGAAWMGYSIAFSGTSHWSLMGQEGVFGAYDDANNKWIWQYVENGRLELRYNGTTQGETANGYFLANNQMRSPIFYDSDNTGFNLNANGSAWQLQTPTGYLRAGPMNTGFCHFNTDRARYYFDKEVQFDGGINDYSGNWRFNDSLGQHDVSLRAPIFYDSANTAKFIDPASTSKVGSDDNYIQIGTSESGKAGVIGNTRTYDGTNLSYGTYWAYDSYYNGSNWAALRTSLGRKWMVDMGYHVNLFRVRYYNGTVSSPWADSAWSNLFTVDSNGSVEASGDFRAPIFYDSNNTNFYVNPDGTTSASFAGDVNFGGELNMVSTTAENKYIDHHGDLRFRYSNNSSFFNERLRIAGASNFTECTGSFRSPVFYDKNNTGYYADFGSTGDSIRAAGDIVAFYSDDRLKDRGDNIANALDKVQSLNGFHYTANETAQKFGYKANPQVGVSAQEVEAVLPEVVKDAAIGHGYKTVDYAKLVPLLIEAIKELKAEVETLKKG